MNCKHIIFPWGALKEKQVLLVLIFFFSFVDDQAHRLKYRQTFLTHTHTPTHSTHKPNLHKRISLSTIRHFQILPIFQNIPTQSVKTMDRKTRVNNSMQIHLGLGPYTQPKSTSIRLTAGDSSRLCMMLSLLLHFEH